MELIHSPQSRSTRIITLLDELGALDGVHIRTVSITRNDGSGGHDPANPHPEGKVPVLIDDAQLIRESAAIMIYLCDRFPDAALAPQPGDATYGSYLSWMVYYGSVMEPVMVFTAAGLVHPYLDATFRGMPELTDRLTAALWDRPYLMGDHFGVVDLLMHSPFAWFPDATADVPAIRDWVARCQDRPAVARSKAFDAALMAQAA